MRKEQPQTAQPAQIPPTPPPFSAPFYPSAQPGNAYEPVKPPDQGSWLDQAAQENSSVYQQQPAVQSAGGYAGQVPAQPPAEKITPAKRKLPNWALITIIVVGILVFFCLIFVVVDALNLYCSLFPKLVNAFVPGYCR